MLKNNRKKAFAFSIKAGKIFIAFVLICFVLNIIIPSQTFSEKENRSLKQKPKMTVKSVFSGDYFRDFNDYCSDQFAGRNLLMSLSAYINLSEGKPESGDVYFSKNCLIGKPEEPSVEQNKKTTDAINRFAKKYPDIRKYLLIVPNAAGIQKDRLPKYAPVGNQLKYIADFQKNIKKGTTILDGITPLKENSDKYIYYKTDHHWTSYGAYEVFKYNFKKMSPKTRMYEYEDFLVTEDFQGTLASKSGRWDYKDDINIYSPKKCKVSYIVNYPDSGEKSTSLFNKNKLDEKDQYQLFFGGNHAVVDIKTSSKSKKVLMVLRDSYASSYVQFLYPYYSRIVMIDPRYYYDNLETAVKTYGITDMLYLYSCDTIVRDNTLSDALGSA